MRLLTFLFLFISYNTYSQQCSSIPGMTPTNSLPVCGSTSFTQTSVASCNGPDIQTSCIDDLVSSNSFFYKFTVYQATPPGLGFVITPQSGTDDYDWTLFDVTGLTNMNDIFTNQSLQVSVNLSANFGPTGCRATGIGNVNCAGPTSQWNQLANVQDGHDYMLMVTNWSNSGLGYGLTFTGGSTVITTSAPTIDDISITGCNSSKLHIVFSKDILCNSVTAAGTEFEIMPGNIPATGIVSSCATGSNAITGLSINLQNPLPPGNYDLVVKTGGDGNTLRDACDVEIPTGTAFPFTIASQPPATITGITYTGCAPTILNVTLSKPVLCNSLTAAGTEFSIPGGPAVSSISSACAGSIVNTTTFQVHLQTPLPHGNYQLVLNNGSDGNTITDTCGVNITPGYAVPFTVTQNTTAPAIQRIDFNICQPDKIIITFDKSVACNSFSSVSEFSITPGTFPINSISACSGNTTQLTLTLSNNLTAGNYNLNINNGTDGNTISDSCFSFIAPGYSVPFTAGQAVLPVFDSVTLDKCNPSYVRAWYSKPIKCSSVSPDGTDFRITGPSAVVIASAVTNTTCSQGYTGWIQLQLTNPINTVGTYTLQSGNGSDGNGIIDTCNATQQILEAIDFNVLVKPDAAFTNTVRWGCIEDTIELLHPGGDGINSWQYTYSDGVIENGQSNSHMFPVSTVSAGIQLIVSNGSCADTSSVSIPLNNAFNAAFTQSADTTCTGRQVVFSDGSTGTGLQYEWQFGDNTTFQGQVAPAHTYNTSQLYEVLLICSNIHGCRDTASSTVYVSPQPVISFTGLNSQYCTREQVSLIADLQGNIENYNWNTGNGQTFSNAPAVSFNYTAENNYTVTLTATDRFCGTTEFTATTDVYLVPLIDLGKDIILCPQMVVEIGVREIAGYRYTWSTGSTSPQIISAPVTTEYVLTADNHGCIASDDLKVEVLDGCLIRVPGAFTPNDDGLNDRLKAINAFLATQFSLRVYNRFGQLLFQTTNPLEGWDGRYKGQDESPGTFVWMLSYIDPWTNKPVSEKGTSILIR